MPRSPSRRAFAALAVSALAGCLSDSNDSEPAESDCNQSVESPDPYPDVQIEHDELPDDADVSMCVEAVEPFTDDSPAKIAVVLQNVGDTGVEYNFGITPPYGGVGHADQLQGEAALLVVPDFRKFISPSDGIVPAEPADGCWRADTGFGGEDIGLTAGAEPGETIRSEYTILAAPESECLVPGTYRSETDYYDPMDDGIWGFDVTLS